MIKPSTWNGKALKGTWHVTLKIDGVRALWNPLVGQWHSRASKPLYNIPAATYIQPDALNGPGWLPGMDCELFLGTLKDSVRACRTQHLKPDTPRITLEHLYTLDPLDPRLDHGLVQDPTAEWIISKLATVNAAGFEGLVLRQGDVWLKVKPHDNYDVLVLSIHQGTGKHKNRMGYLKTHMGDVGTGFTDGEREWWWARGDHILSQEQSWGTIDKITIEVECMQLTPDGKFRHARFVRIRDDKIADR